MRSLRTTLDDKVDFLKTMYDWDGIKWELRSEQLVTSLLPNLVANQLLAQIQQFERDTNAQAFFVFQSRKDTAYYRVVVKLDKWNFESAVYNVHLRNQTIIDFLNAVHRPQEAYSWGVYHGSVCCLGPSVGYFQPALFSAFAGAQLYQELRTKFSAAAIAAGFSDNVTRKFCNALEMDDHRGGCHHRLRANLFVYTELYELAVDYLEELKEKPVYHPKDLLSSSSGSSL